MSYNEAELLTLSETLAEEPPMFSQLKRPLSPSRAREVLPEKPVGKRPRKHQNGDQQRQGLRQQHQYKDQQVEANDVLTNKSKSLGLGGQGPRSVPERTYLQRADAMKILEDLDRERETVFQEERKRGDERFQPRSPHTREMIRELRKVGDRKRARAQELRRIQKLRELETAAEGIPISHLYPTVEMGVRNDEVFESRSGLKIESQPPTLGSFPVAGLERGERDEDECLRKKGPCGKRPALNTFSRGGHPQVSRGAEDFSTLPKFVPANVNGDAAEISIPLVKPKKKKESLKARFIADFKKRVDQAQDIMLRKTTAEYQAKREKAIKIQSEVLDAAATLQEEWEALQGRNNPPLVARARDDVEAYLRQLSELANEPVKKYKKLYDEIAQINKELLIQQTKAANLATTNEAFFDKVKLELDALEKSTFEQLKSREKAFIEKQRKKERMALEALSG